VLWLCALVSDMGCFEWLTTLRVTMRQNLENLTACLSPARISPLRPQRWPYRNEINCE
jgi:hypothetical protein